MKLAPSKPRMGSNAAERPSSRSRSSDNRLALRGHKPTALRLAGLALAGILLAWGCSGSRPAVLSDPTAPPTGYQRRMVLVLERPGFYPAAGVEVKIEVEAPTRLVSPASGRGRTNGQGALELVFEPLAHYDQPALKGGDVVAEFPVKATLIIGGGVRRVLEDRQTFARYADPLYQGLNRDPETKPTYHNITLGR